MNAADAPAGVPSLTIVHSVAVADGETAPFAMETKVSDALFAAELGNMFALNAAEEMKTAGLVAEKAPLTATAAPAPGPSTAQVAEVPDIILAANATKQASNTGRARIAAAPAG